MIIKIEYPYPNSIEEPENNNYVLAYYARQNTIQQRTESGGRTFVPYITNS